MTDSPEVASQFLEAYATGGQISLSLGEYMTKIASTDYAGQLAEHLRFDAAGVSLAQGRNNSQKAQESVQQKIESALSQKERDDVFNFSAGQVYLQILEGIETTERFAPEVDKTYATLVSNYYATQAKRLGITPEELFNRFPVQIQVTQNVELNAFTQKELDHAKAEIQNAINIAAGQGHQQNTIAIAPVKDWLANIVKAHANVDISGFRHSIDTSAIRHIFNNHGNKKSEISRGLIAVTEQDFLSIPEIIGNPDKVILGTKNNIGREQVVYLKSMPDGSTLYLEEIRTGRGMLTAQSMRRYPATVHSSSILSTLLHTRPNPTSQGSPIVIDNPVISNTPPSYKMVLPTHMTPGMEEGDGQRIADMYDGKDDVRALLLGQIEGKLLQDAQNAGLDIKNFSYTVDQSALNHTRNNHGSGSTEILRGQVPVTADDVARIPDIVENYDGLRFGFRSGRDLPVIGFAKQYGDAAILYFVEVRKKRRDLAALSMRRYPATSDAVNILNNLPLYAQNDGGHRDIISNETGQDNILGTFAPDSLTISLLEKANLSTFLHESGHLFLEMQESDLSLKKHPPSFKI